jgi:cell division protein FtsW
MMVRKWDQGLLLSVLFLLGFGLVQVYSSSFIFAIESNEDGLFFFRKQFIFAAISLTALFVVASIPWKWSKRVAWVFLGLAIFGLILTYVPGIAIKAGGAHRWIKLPLGQRFEPSEMLKVTFPFLLAFVLTDDKRRFGTLEWPIRFLMVTVPMLFLLGQPDFGSFAICAAMALGVWFAFGLRWTYVFGAVLVSIPAFYFLVLQVPYRYARIQAFLDPWSDPSHKGFQVIQSMLSFHSGKLWGSGLGQGQGKLFFLPEAHTDFTLAVLGEEMGFIGFLIVLSIYGFVILRSLQLAVRAETSENRAIALGICLMFSLQTFINMGVVMGLLPTKGLTLPFLSYGGSSLLCTCLAMGWLLNLDSELRAAPIVARSVKKQVNQHKKIV